MATFKNFNDYTKAFFTKLENEQMKKGFFLSVVDTIGTMGERIFELGEATDGADIGSYNTTDEIYVSDKASPKKTSRNHSGKNGDKTFKSGKSHKTTYYPSYSEFRFQMGRTSPNVNLNLTGRLYRNFLNSFVPSDKNGNSFVKFSKKAVPKKLGNFEYGIALRQENMDKATGMEAHFGKVIFQMTENEKQKFKETVLFEFNKVIKK